jgi:hypothetical protein
MCTILGVKAQKIIGKHSCTVQQLHGGRTINSRYWMMNNNSVIACLPYQLPQLAAKKCVTNAFLIHRLQIDFSVRGTLQQEGRCTACQRFCGWPGVQQSRF